MLEMFNYLSSDTRNLKIENREVPPTHPPPLTLSLLNDFVKKIRPKSILPYGCILNKATIRYKFWICRII